MLLLRALVFIGADDEENKKSIAQRDSSRFQPTRTIAAAAPVHSAGIKRNPNLRRISRNGQRGDRISNNFIKK